MKSILLFCCVIFMFVSARSQDTLRKQAEVLVAGGGTGGVAAGIQSARTGASTIIVSAIPWLGGMLTAAGVSATDGNDDLPSGIWREFRQALYRHYGTHNLQTGWVSSTLFEPHVGDSIFKALCAREKKLEVIYNYRFLRVLKQGSRVTGAVFTNKAGKQLIVHAAITIDATELGDVFSNAGAAYDLGMDARSYSGEKYALSKANKTIQDITYAAILKDYGKETDKTIPRPASYDPSFFSCSCAFDCNQPKVVSCSKLLDYGRLPDHKFMINWPIHGNDYYVNAVEMTDKQRDSAYAIAKERTFSFIYYIQHELGFRNLGLADDEFPTTDRLPFIPYNREGRRVRGIIRYTINEIQDPYHSPDKFYRTGIAVGDYPVDQHHSANKNAPKLTLPPIPSFNVPLGCLIPENIQGLVVAEKGISVTNLVNGCTRLQPCVLLTGQAAGALAAFAAMKQIQPATVNIRQIQEILLKQKCYLMPFADVKPEDGGFAAIQRVGVTGILQGTGVPHGWENHTWFYPDSPSRRMELLGGLNSYDPAFALHFEGSGSFLTRQEAVQILFSFIKTYRGRLITPLSRRFRDGSEKAMERWIDANWETGLKMSNAYNKNGQITRRELAILLNTILDPFHLKNLDFHGTLLKQ